MTDDQPNLTDEVTRRLAASCDGVGPSPASLPGAHAHVYATSAAGRPLRLFVFKPSGDGPHPAVMLFFGGGFERGDVDGLAGQAETLAERGYIAILPDYDVRCRDGTDPMAAMSDGRRAYAWLFENAEGLSADTGRVALGGGSAGGGIALMCAIRASAERRPAALVLFNPSATLVPAAAAFGLTHQEAVSESPLEADLRGLPPTIVFHGKADRIIPVESSKRLRSAIVADGGACELVLYDGMDHGFFNSRDVDAGIGASPYADTLARMIAFLAATV